MVQSVKQCAGCGAQMGARGRVCPRCGRGSLFGELIWIAVLGVMLLAIAVLSGLMPINRIPGVERWTTAPSGKAGSTRVPPLPRAFSGRHDAQRTPVSTRPPLSH